MAKVESKTREFVLKNKKLSLKLFSAFVAVLAIYLATKGNVTLNGCSHREIFDETILKE